MWQINKQDKKISQTLRVFSVIVKKRGKLWDDINMMKSRISKLPKNSFLDNLKKFLIENKKNYYNEIFKL